MTKNPENIDTSAERVQKNPIAELMREAAKALNDIDAEDNFPLPDDLMRAAEEIERQEPVARRERKMGNYKVEPVEPVGLTDEQIFHIAEPFGAFEFGDAQGGKTLAFARAILAAAPDVQQPAPDVSALVEALEELVDLMEDTRQGEYIPDSFTTQPARIALAALAAHRSKGGEV